MRGAARVVILDIVGPLVVFQLATVAGVSAVWALVFSGFTPVIAVVADWVRWRTLEVVGSVVLGGIAVSVLLALISSDPRIVLLEGAVLTSAFGLVCLVSLVKRRPLIFYFAQVFYGGQHATRGQELDSDYDTYPEARSFWRTLSVVWGVVYLVESAARVAIIVVASTRTALLVNRTLPWLMYAALLLVSFTWGRRLEATKPEPSEVPASHGNDQA